MIQGSGFLHRFRTSKHRGRLIAINVYLSLQLALPFSWGWSQQIVPDGNTATSVAEQGTVTDVTTGTVKDDNAFNSFTVFDVYQGNTVNLHLPGGTSNLINLVHGKQSNIDGILNSYKNGAIGGNVYFANPYGIIIGPTGVVNVGSLTALDRKSVV